MKDNDFEKLNNNDEIFFGDIRSDLSDAEISEIEALYMQALDEEVPDIWDKIEAGLDAPDNKNDKVISITERKRKKKTFMTMLIAASVLVILIPSYIFGVKSLNKKDAKDSAGRKNPVAAGGAEEQGVKDDGQYSNESASISYGDKSDKKNTNTLGNKWKHTANKDAEDIEIVEGIDGIRGEKSENDGAAVVDSDDNLVGTGKIYQDGKDIVFVDATGNVIPIDVNILEENDKKKVLDGEELEVEVTYRFNDDGCEVLSYNVIEQ